MLKLHKDSKSKGAGSRQMCQLWAAIYKITISGSGGEQAEHCWRLRDYLWEVSLWACFVLVLSSRHSLLAAFGDKVLG